MTEKIWWQYILHFSTVCTVTAPHCVSQRTLFDKEFAKTRSLHTMNLLKIVALTKNFYAALRIGKLLKFTHSVVISEIFPHLKIFSSNWLTVQFFSENLNLTEFLQKIVREKWSNYHTVRYFCITIFKSKWRFLSFRLNSNVPLFIKDRISRFIEFGLIAAKY